MSSRMVCPAPWPEPSPDRRGRELAAGRRPRRPRCALRFARLLRPALDAVPQALAVELGLDGELGAAVGAGELADRAAGLEGGGELAGLALVPARARARGEFALGAGARLALGGERVEQALPGDHGQRQLGPVRRGERGEQPAARQLEGVAAIALPPLDPVPRHRLLRLVLAIPLRHGTPPE